MAHNRSMRTRALVALPVRNEAAIVAASAASLQNLFGRYSKEFVWHLVISDNGSTDGTGIEARRATRSDRNVSHLHSDRPGKGLAIRAAWESREADVYAFTDADLAADIDLLPSLVRGIIDGNDICAASRRLPGAHVHRPAFDRLTSVALNALVRRLCGSRLTDTSCGLKVVSPRVVRELVPLARNNTWAFDTELLLLAQWRGFRIREVPIRWTEPRTRTRGHLLTKALVAGDYLRALHHLSRRKGPSPDGEDGR